MAAFVLLAVWYATSERHPSGRGPVTGMARLWASVVLVSTQLMTVGLVEYLRTRGPLRRTALAVLLAPGGALLAVSVLRRRRAPSPRSAAAPRARPR